MSRPITASRNSKRRGFSLVELMFAVALFALLGGVLFILAEATVRLYAKNVSVMLCEWTARKAINHIRPRIERGTDFFDMDRIPFVLLDENGGLLPANARFGLGVRITTADAADPSLLRYVAYRVVDGRELRYYPDASALPNGDFQVLTDNLSAPTSIGAAGTQREDFPFHYTSDPPPDSILLDLNLKVRSRSYDQFLSRSHEFNDVETPNTFFQIRTVVGRRR